MEEQHHLPFAAILLANGGTPVPQMTMFAVPILVNIINQLGMISLGSLLHPFESGVVDTSLGIVGVQRL